MYTNFDYEEEKQEMEDRVANFFGEFSSEIRNKLMSKNLVKPQNLYDVFYPAVKKELLSKNVNLFNVDLDEFSTKIRDGQLAKAVEKTFSLEEQSEDFRKSMLAREQLHKSTVDLLSSFEENRKNLLSKNHSSLSDLIKDSEFQRRNNVSKNRENPNLEKQLNDNQDKYREESLGRNLTKEQDLVLSSEDYRNGNLSKNNSKESSLEDSSKEFRNSDLALNNSVVSDLEKIGAEYREDDLSRNVSKENNLESQSESFRKEELSKNELKSYDIESDSVQFRQNEESKNIPKTTDLETDSASFRDASLRNNEIKDSNLETDSIKFRESDLSYNAAKKTDLETISKIFRQEDLSVNNPTEQNLEKDSVGYRESILSNNIKKATSIEDSSESFRVEELAQNNLKQTDLLTDSKDFQKSNLSNNILSTSDLESDSKSFRGQSLSNNTKKETDLEKDSKPHREEDLSVNIPKTTNLEKDSVPFRASDLSENHPKNTDLEKDSVSFREGDLSENKPKVTDIEKDSVPFRAEDLAANIAKTTDLEKDSVVFREELEAINVHNNSDLEKDSVSFRQELETKNVPNGSDLEIDSVSFREELKAINVPNNSNLEADSATFREELISTNVPNGSDLQIDSVPFREELKAINVPGDSDLQIDSVPFREEMKVSNVPGTETIDRHKNQYGKPSDSDEERDYNLSKNVPTNQSIDRHYDQYGGINSGNNERLANLNKNEGSGLLGTNILGPGGTSVFVGVSGVLAQGLVFRPLLTMRNKYYDTVFKSRYYRESDASNFGLLSDTLTVPSQGEILAGTGLPMNPSDSINSRVENFAQITSPIERSLQYAYSSADAQVQFLKYYSIFSNTNIKKVNIDYDLDNTKIIYNSFDLKKRMDFELPSENINNLIRQYLKYSNPFGLAQDGVLKRSNSEESVFSIFSKINTLAQSPDGKSIQDLINSYDLFSQERLNRILKSSSKSLNAPSGTYFGGDVEKQYDENYGNIDDSNVIFKKYAGNPLHDSGFDIKTKGVRYILKRASESGSDFNINFQDIQGVVGAPSKSYVVGKTKMGEKRMGYQKYTIQNPYAPDKAGKLIFCFTNYSNGKTMYFPPYINSFQNSETANWNATNFLGRPEAVYTYNNSSRDGSISFFVLTDYAESVVIGRDQDTNMAPISITIDKNFSTDVKESKSIIDGLNAKIKDIMGNTLENNNSGSEQSASENQRTVAIMPKTETGSTTNVTNETNISAGDSDKINDKKQKNNQLINGINDTINNIGTSTSKTNYSESSEKVRNINDFNVTSKGAEDGYVDTKVQDTKIRINEMIKNLAFQPAYFSGSKADFKSRMEFLSKMTRPANNTSKGGFSFTKPPVCHLILGDWINHDIIVNSVSYDYAGAPWTDGIDDGIVQPMWASVTVSFNIIGGAGDSGGVPLTSTDVEGFFGTKSVRG